MISIPRIRFAHLPTPIESLPKLSALLDGPSIYLKRDDQTGLALGGNKTRKLEFLVAEAQANGARTLITAGAVQSNHCRQTAAAAARFGFDCLLVLSGEAESSFSGNLLLDDLLGAQIVWASKEDRDQVLQNTFKAAWDSGKRPYLIPYGGSNPTGAASYAFAIKELLDQAGSSPLSGPPDWIVFATSSGGTQAGMMVGARLFGYEGKILGISVDVPAEKLQHHVANLAAETAGFLGESVSFKAEEVLVDDTYLGGGYGVLGPPEIESIRLFAQSEGVLLDPVYTGRASAGLVDLIRKGRFSRGEKVLFWHTGGTPALFARRYHDQLEK
jgi:D-cysteine desulfhydrase family pyridoxal phosphate-dependent enzyme